MPSEGRGGLLPRPIGMRLSPFLPWPMSLRISAAGGSTTRCGTCTTVCGRQDRTPHVPAGREVLPSRRGACPRIGLGNQCVDARGLGVGAVRPDRRFRRIPRLPREARLRGAGPRPVRQHPSRPGSCRDGVERAADSPRSHHGFGVYDEERISVAEWRTRFAAGRAEMLEPAALAEFARACEFLSRLSRTQAPTKVLTTYNLKHSAERWHRHRGIEGRWDQDYVSNGMLLAAAYHLGFQG